MKMIFGLFFAALIQGCAVNTDVSQKLKLTGAQANASEKIRQALTSPCVKVNYASQSDEKPRPGGVQITTAALVTRLYEGQEGWYRGTVIAQGIIDEVFYNEKTGRIVCGQKDWNRFSNSARVSFTEVGIPLKPSL
jgi:hypothetical protein